MASFMQGERTAREPGNPLLRRAPAGPANSAVTHRWTKFGKGFIVHVGKAFYLCIKEERDLMSETMLFRTPVQVTPPAHPIQPYEDCVLLGSCFAQEMGARMTAHGLRALCNPLGTLYNPASIARLVHHALKGRQEPLPVLETHGQWHCWLAGTQVEEATREAITTRMAHELSRLGQALSSASHLFVTLGTNVCYRLHSDGSVVTNCHKMPASLFQEDTLSLAQCTETLQDMTRELLEENPRLHITFTISPYRYAKYGFHRSQLAKSVLLLAVEEVCRGQQAVHYFPAYEILLDELRDYRFYADDMLHPSQMAADYIWQRFCQAYMSERTRQYIQEYEPVRKGLAHRPSDPGSPQHLAFVRGLEEKAAELRRKYGMEEEATHDATDATGKQ